MKKSFVLIFVLIAVFLATAGCVSSPQKVFSTVSQTLDGKTVTVLVAANDFYTVSIAGGESYTVDMQSTLVAFPGGLLWVCPDGKEYDLFTTARKWGPLTGKVQVGDKDGKRYLKVFKGDTK